MLNYTSNPCGTTHILIGAPSRCCCPALSVQVQTSSCVLRGIMHMLLPRMPTSLLCELAEVSAGGLAQSEDRSLSMLMAGDGGNGAATTTLVDVNGCPGTGTGGATDPGAGNSNYVQYPTLVQGYSGGYCNANATYPGLAYCPASQPEWSAYRCGAAQHQDGHAHSVG